MKRSAAVLLAALTMTPLIPAARAHAQAAGPFPEVTVPRSPGGSATWAYVSIGAGFALLGTSTLLADRANDRYEEYQRSTDPDDVRRLYDETITLDRYSTGTLLGGELLIATGLYLRFLRRPAAASRVALDVGPTRCALALRF